jgi:hypothetical protein
VGEGRPVPLAEVTQSERATHTETAWAGSVRRAGDVGGVRPDRQTLYQEHYHFVIIPDRPICQCT